MIVWIYMNNLLNSTKSTATPLPIHIVEESALNCSANKERKPSIKNSSPRRPTAKVCIPANYTLHPSVNGKNI